LSASASIVSILPVVGVAWAPTIVDRMRQPSSHVFAGTGKVWTSDGVGWAPEEETGVIHRCRRCSKPVGASWSPLRRRLDDGLHAAIASGSALAAGRSPTIADAVGYADLADFNRQSRALEA
jgi:hypothetical protein